jgi:hypothetical protein
LFVGFSNCCSCRTCSARAAISQQFWLCRVWREERFEKSGRFVSFGGTVYSLQGRQGGFVSVEYKVVLRKLFKNQFIIQNVKKNFEYRSP